MSQQDKLIEKLQSDSEMTFEEVEKLLKSFGFARDNKGKTSGSRVMFSSPDFKTKILLHKPHPRKELLTYQKKQLAEQLKQEGLI